MTKRTTKPKNPAPLISIEEAFELIASGKVQVEKTDFETSVLDLEATDAEEVIEVTGPPRVDRPYSSPLRGYAIDREAGLSESLLRIISENVADARRGGAE